MCMNIHTARIKYIVRMRKWMSVYVQICLSPSLSCGFCSPSDSWTVLCIMPTSNNWFFCKPSNSGSNLIDLRPCNIEVEVATSKIWTKWLMQSLHFLCSAFVSVRMMILVKLFARSRYRQSLHSRMASRLVRRGHRGGRELHWTPILSSAPSFSVG